MKSFARNAAKAFLLLLKVASEPFLVRAYPVVTLCSLRGWRWPVFLLHALTREAVVGISWRDLTAAYRILPFSTFITRVRIASLLPVSRRGTLLWNRNAGLELLCSRSVEIDVFYYKVHSADAFVLPYFAHPNFYTRGGEIIADEAASRQTSCRQRTLVFMGNADSAQYNSVHIQKFGLLTRPQIIGCIREVLQEEGFRPLRLRSFVHTAPKSIREAEDHEHSFIDFLKIVSDSDFFVAPPGWQIPHSHNIVEAMSTGAIPLTNYHRFMVPPLINGVNCLAFDTLEELKNALATISTMPQSQVHEMRRAVFAYYAEHLRPDSVGRSLIKRLPFVSRIVVNSEETRVDPRLVA